SRLRPIMWLTIKCTSSTSVDVDGSKARKRSSISGFFSWQHDIVMAEYNASLLGKCLNSSASDTPASSANSRVVVPWKPFSANTRRTALIMAARRSSLVSFKIGFMLGPELGSRKVSIYLLTTQRQARNRRTGESVGLEAVSTATCLIGYSVGSV